MWKKARVGPNFDETILSTRARYFDSVKSSWLPEFHSLTYSKTKKMTLDPPLSPVSRKDRWQRNFSNFEYFTFEFGYMTANSV